MSEDDRELFKPIDETSLLANIVTPVSKFGIGNFQIPPTFIYIQEGVNTLSVSESQLRALLWLETLDKKENIVLIKGAYEVTITKLMFSDSGYLSSKKVAIGRGVQLLGAIEQAKADFEKRAV